MRITITCPSFAAHGGIRVILEWANRLTEWHEVFILTPALRCTWFKINPAVRLIKRPIQTDLWILSSPHAMQYINKPGKKVVFCQMAEGFFNDNPEWQRLCMSWYLAPYTMIAISKWNIDLFEQLGRVHETHYVGNGVNLTDFPIREKNKFNRTILVEGLGNPNPSKDPEGIGARVAGRLSEKFRIISYSAYKFNNFNHQMTPSLLKLNQMYEQADILLKVTKFDARSCSPVEAMTKGTVTVRGIIKGDDDLNDSNSVRCSYSEDEIYHAAIELMTDHQRRMKLSMNCIEYAKTNTWDKWMKEINRILCEQ